MSLKVTEDIQDFIDVMMDGIINAVYSFGTGSKTRNRIIRIRIRYRRVLEYSVVIGWP